jgi:hypothetical protein
MAEQEEEVTATMEVDASELASLVGGQLLKDNKWLRDLADSPAFATEFVKNPIAMRAFAAQAGTAAGTSIAQGLTR